MAWERPTSVPFPSIWRRFTGKRKTADGKLVKFKIQDVPEEIEDELLEIMSTKFLQDDFLCASQNLLDDPVSVKEFQDMWRKCLKQKTVIVALVDDEDDSGPRIAGANFTGVVLKSDKRSVDMFKGETLRTLMNFAYGYAQKSIDVFQLYKVDAYISAMGLIVLPEYRGHGLCEEIIKARFDLGRAIGLKATMNTFSPVAAQRAAVKAGMEVLAEVFYEDYKVDGKVVFSSTDTKSLKVMSAAIKQ